MAKSKKLIPRNTRRTVNDLIDQGVRINQIPAGSNLMNTSVTDECAKFMPNANNIRTICKGDAYIVLGADMPSNFLSGFGGKGAKSPTIDLVVGRMSSINDGDGPEPGQKVGNSFFTDAARIYISQLTKVDKNFGIANEYKLFGRPDEAIVGSAISIKADSVRLIGREGVKIVTGKADGVKLGPDGELNSRGGKIKTPAPPIWLLAGNNISRRKIPGGKFLAASSVNTLQPVVLGENTVDCIRELGDLVDELANIVQNMSLLQQSLNTVLGVTPLAHHATAVGATTPFTLQSVITSLHMTRASIAMWELNYVSKRSKGYKYICSENVMTT